MKPETPRGDVLEEGDDRRLEPDGAGCLRSSVFSGVGAGCEGTVGGEMGPVLMR